MSLAGLRRRLARLEGRLGLPPAMRRMDRVLHELEAEEAAFQAVWSTMTPAQLVAAARRQAWRTSRIGALRTAMRTPQERAADAAAVAALASLSQAELLERYHQAFATEVERSELDKAVLALVTDADLVEMYRQSIRGGDLGSSRHGPAEDGMD
jgi:hypothetical protein